MAERRQGSITYREAGAEYFDQRKLRRHAGVWSLWALGVGAVISGDFFGWNFGLAYGFGGLLVATLVITVMYFGLCYSIAEMSPALPHTGGAYSFSRSAMEPPTLELIVSIPISANSGTKPSRSQKWCFFSALLFFMAEVRRRCSV